MKQSRSKWRSPSRVAVALFIALGGVALPVFGLLNDDVAGADVPPITTGFYLDLGASESVGVQPTAADPRGQRTAQGYSNDLVAYEAARGVTLQLTELGCPGESTGTMINGGDHCYLSPDSQLSEALSFLRSHQGDNGIVTIDIGFNNLRRCFANEAVSQSCVRSAIDAVRLDMPTILQSLKSVSGPGVTFVGLGHYDPFLADSLLGPTGQKFAHESGAAFNWLNETLRSAYTNAGVSMATVGAAFDSRDVERVHMSGAGRVPENVASTCQLTWMCEPPPYGPNLHPNDAGYAMIASAIESELKAPW